MTSLVKKSIEKVFTSIFVLLSKRFVRQKGNQFSDMYVCVWGRGEGSDGPQARLGCVE